MHDNRINDVEADVICEAIGRALLEFCEEQTRDGRPHSRLPGGIYSSHGDGKLMARVMHNAGWVIISSGWGSGDLPWRLLDRAIVLYHQYDRGIIIDRQIVRDIIRTRYTLIHS